MHNEIQIKHLTEAECLDNLLKDFSRRQTVTRCWRMVDGRWQLQDIRYTEDWDQTQKDKVATSLAACLHAGGQVTGAFLAGKLIGFASIEPTPFGSELQYLNLAMMHVSSDMRGKGVGRQLFAVMCECARQMGAKKLYISAHSAEESMAFYRKVGCVDAQEINRRLAEEEPCDCQLEYTL